jgi:hypothetical protein
MGSLCDFVPTRDAVMDGHRRAYHITARRKRLPGRLCVEQLLPLLERINLSQCQSRPFWENFLVELKWRLHIVLAIR